MLFQTSLDKIKRWLLQGHIRHYRTLSSALPDTLTIAGISIRQDAQGRFCLNDLHKAAVGNVEHYHPYDWDRSLAGRESSVAIGELLRSEGRSKDWIDTLYCEGRVLFAGREHALAYAKFIGPHFAFVVEQAMDRTAQAATPVAAPSPIVPFANATNSGVLTMSSREIAELTGKEHKNVLADVRKMLGELGKAAAEFSATAQTQGPNNSIRTIEVFNLPKDLTITLVSGYNVQVRHRIVTRWMELEEKARGPMFKSPTSVMESMQQTMQALQLAMQKEQENQILLLENKVKDEVIEEMAPKAEFHA